MHMVFVSQFFPSTLHESSLFHISTCRCYRSAYKLQLAGNYSVASATVGLREELCRNVYNADSCRQLSADISAKQPRSEESRWDGAEMLSPGPRSSQHRGGSTRWHPAPAAHFWVNSRRNRGDMQESRSEHNLPTHLSPGKQELRKQDLSRLPL